ncbi:hypothetical protein J6590_001763 [Homalodisca vitripennis]|nr:hypothetical protein J6590_001763 [Homalodisca vitripennis]
MDSCQIIYLLSSIAYLTLYYSGGSWIHPDDSFAWSRFIFLTAMLMLMEKYDLVPPPLSCPPLYMLYKVVAAVIIANIALITVWWQTEDFLKWFVSTAIKLIQLLPVVGPKVEEADETFWASVVQILISSYFLLWVFLSTGIIFGKQRRSRNTYDDLISSRKYFSCCSAASLTDTQDSGENYTSLSHIRSDITSMHSNSSASSCPPPRYSPPRRSTRRLSRSRSRTRCS